MAISATMLGTHTHLTLLVAVYTCVHNHMQTKRQFLLFILLFSPALPSPFLFSLHTVVLVRRAMKVLHQQQAQKNGGGWGGGASGFGGHGGSIRGSYSTASAIGPRDANEQVPISCRHT
jgi:hypothetical protein